MKSRTTVGSRLANCELAKSDSDPKLEINVHVTEPKSLLNTLKALYNNSTVLYSSGWSTNKPLITRFSCLANLLACELIIPQQTTQSPRDA